MIDVWVAMLSMDKGYKHSFALVSLHLLDTKQTHKADYILDALMMKN